MGTFLIIVGIAAWVISPLVLIPLYMTAKTEKKHQKDLLLLLYAEERATKEELLRAGIPLNEIALVRQASLPPANAARPLSGRPESAQMLPPGVSPAIQVRPGRECAAGSAVSPSAAHPQPDPRAELAKLRRLRDEGTLSAEEYASLAAAQEMRIAQLPPEPPIAEKPAAEIPAAEKPAAEVPAAEKPAAEVPAAEKPAAEVPAAERPVHPQGSPLRPAAEEAAFEPESGGLRISAITAMLSVGVILIIVAGVLLVRSSWSTMSDFGRLALLGAGSVLFFGTSELANRLWKLERTGMAFFTLGAAFLPISIWAAGYFHLLGERLAGPANQFTIALAFLAFTLIALAAVRRWGQTGWGFAAFGGAMLTYLYFLAGFFWADHKGILLLAAALPAIVLAFAAPELEMRLPDALARAAVPFTLFYAAAVSVLIPAGFLTKQEPLCGLAAMLCAAAFLSPLFCERLKGYTAVPMCIELLLGTALMLHPFLENPVSWGTYLALTVVFAAAVTVILILTRTLPETVQNGFCTASVVLVCAAALLELAALPSAHWTLPAGAALLAVLLVLCALRIGGPLYRPAAALQAWALCLTVAGAIRMFGPLKTYRNPAFLTAGALAVCCFAGFFAVKKLRSGCSDLLFPLTSGAYAVMLLSLRALPVWQTAAGIALLLISVTAFWMLAAWHPQERAVKCIFAVLAPVLLLAAEIGIQFRPDCDHGWPDITRAFWAVLATGFALLTLLMLRKQHTRARALMLWLFAVPPVLFTFLGFDLYSSGWFYLHTGVCFTFCFGAAAARRSSDAVQHIFPPAAAGVLAVTGYCAREGMILSRNEPFEPALTGWVILSFLCAGAAFLLRRKQLTPGRRILFWAHIIPPVLLAFFALQLYSTGLFYVHTGLAALVCWMIAAERRYPNPFQRVFALLPPVLFGIIAAGAAHGYLSRDIVSGDTAVFGWVCILLILAIPAYLLEKRQHTPARQLLFWATALPPVAAAVTAPALYSGDLMYLHMLIGALLSLFAVFAYKSKYAIQHVFAVILPAILISAAISAEQTHFSENRQLCAVLWTAASLLTALAALLANRRQTASVRMLLFGTCSVPPVLAAFCSPERFGSTVSYDWVYVQIGLAAVFGLTVWQLLAKRGKAIPAAGFAVGILLLSEGSALAAKYHLFEGKSGFAPAMTGCLWMLLAGIAAVCIRFGLFKVRGQETACRVMNVLMPAAALGFAVALYALTGVEWKPLFFLYTAAFCVTGWLTTERRQILLPGAALTALFIALESARIAFTDGRNARAAIVLFCFAGLALLLPYLGVVGRENITEPVQKRRSYVLTAGGGIVPLWLLAAACEFGGTTVTGQQRRWMFFFVPVLIAGFLLHFTFEETDERTRRALFTAAAVSCTVSLWMQPFFTVESGSYWDGKLHLLPLIMFGAVIRKLYGEEIGGSFFFAIGVYSMIRLAVAAVQNEKTADLLTILTAALVIFIVSFFVKQKKWFLLGGASLCGIAVYLRMKIFPDMPWWVWLLTAGILLIAVAATNEMLKQRGDSLKERAGRLMEDWKW